MLEITIQYDENKDSKMVVIVNGKADSITIFRNDRIKFLNIEVVEIIKKETAQELFKRLKASSKFFERLKMVSFDEEMSNYVSLVWHFLYGVDNSKFRMFYRNELRLWSKPWSFMEFVKELNRIVNSKKFKLKHYKLSSHKDKELDNDFYGINGFLPASTDIGTMTNEIWNFLTECINEASENLSERIMSESVVTYFNFPNQIKSACNQYLIYFSQFLADLGIEVDTEVKEDASQTLFKVTPKNKGEALYKIREALNIYLSLTDPDNVIIQSDSDIQSLTLKANIDHLNGQLNLAKALVQSKDSTIQSKNATIDALSFTNLQYKQLLGKHEIKKESEEEVFDGLASIKKYEGKGFSINFPEMFRLLKNWIKEKNDVQ